jgi:predicted metal-dependent enzyme (double-stranded beta helix superfamily)
MMSGESDQNAVYSPDQNRSHSVEAFPVMLMRQRFLLKTADIVRSGASRVHSLISALLADTIADPEFLHGLTLESAASSYARTVIFSAESYCVLAILWRPGQMSPVHSHRAWCALGVHAGTLTETQFEPVADRLGHGLRLSGCRQLHAGATSHGPAHDPSAHRMANLGIEPAISIHVYGTAFDRLGSELNRVWAD